MITQRGIWPSLQVLSKAESVVGGSGHNFDGMMRTLFAFPNKKCLPIRIYQVCGVLLFPKNCLEPFLPGSMHKGQWLYRSDKVLATHFATKQTNSGQKVVLLFPPGEERGWGLPTTPQMTKLGGAHHLGIEVQADHLRARV